MKKRMLAMLMAMCLMLTLVPMAFAQDSQPDTITLPNGEVVEIPVLDELPMTMDVSEAPWSGSGTEADPFLITDEASFLELRNTQWSLRNYYFKLTQNLTFNGNAQDEWTGLLTYFWGTIDGKINETTNAVISGVGDNRFLIYGWFGGTIKNIEFNWNGDASMITFSPGRLSSDPITYDHFTLSNVITTSYNNDGRVPIVLSSDSQSNYSPFIYCAAGEFLMKDCKNYIDLSGNAYASVFFGYRIIDTIHSTYTFDGCENHGDINYRNTGLFFGNSSGMDETATSKVTIYTNANATGDHHPCYNYGKITGVQSVNLFCSAPNNQTLPSNCTAFDTLLEQNIHGSSNCNDAYCNRNHSGYVVPSTTIAGMGISKNADNMLVINQPTDVQIHHYELTYVAYVQRYDPDYPSKGYWNGNSRFTITQRNIPADSSSDYIVSNIGAYDLRDDLDDSWNWSDGEDGSFIVDDGTSRYYWLDAEQKHQNGVTWHTNQDADKHVCAPQLFILAAYSGVGADTLIGTVVVEAAQIAESGV